MIGLNKFLTLLNFATNSLPYVGLNIIVSVAMFTIFCLTSQLTYLKLETKKVNKKCHLCDQAILREVLYNNSATRVGLYYI